MKIPAIASLLLFAGACVMYGGFLFLIRNEWIAPERLRLFPPLALVWAGLCVAFGIVGTSRKGKEKHAK